MVKGSLSCHEVISRRKYTNQTEAKKMRVVCRSCSKTGFVRHFARIAVTAAAFFPLLAGAVIFGNDDRHVITSRSPIETLAQATAIAVLNTNYSVHSSGLFDLQVGSLDVLCKDEPLAHEPSLSYSCTGFLVAPNLLVTAGHCVYAVNSPHQELNHESGLACAAFDWYFGFEAKVDGTVQTTGIAANQLYHCKQIIYAVQQEASPYLDYALIELDRPVANVSPLKMTDDKLSAGRTLFVGSSVSMIGHPFGTPRKYTDHGHVVLNNSTRSSFITNLDAFEGNSGSPVLDATNSVVGILVGGTPSANTYVDAKNKCERFNRCDEDGTHCLLPDLDTSLFPGFQKTGSEVQRIAPVLELLRSQKN
jgi:V8-like Glu-specific endopeptidase